MTANVSAPTTGAPIACAAMGSPFRPRSFCGVGCVDDGPPEVGLPLRVIRLGTLAAMVVVTFLSAAVVRLVPGVARRRRAASLVVRSAARATLALLGVERESRVRLPAERALVVANHISWLDVVAVLAERSSTGRLRLVAKVEVARWPVIGGLAELIGTIFIDRCRPLTLPDTVNAVRDALNGGDVVVVFAEGTTCCGVHRAPYRPAMFQAAVDASARVVPVTIRYADRHGTVTTVPAFLGDETLVASIRRLAGRRTTRVGIRVGAALHPGPGADRRHLAAAAQHVTAREVRRTAVVPMARPATVLPTLTTAGV